MYPNPAAYHNGWQKFCIRSATLRDWDSWALAYAVYAMHRRYAPFVQGWRVLSQDEINIVPHTSPGWPFSLAVNNKARALKNYGARIDEFWERVGKGEEPPVIWSGFIKQELLKYKKTSVNDGRVIANPPVEFSNLGSRVRQDFNLRLHNAWKSTPYSIGFTKYRRGTHHLAVRLNRFPNKRELDEKAYDMHWDRVRGLVIHHFRRSTMSPAHKTPENLRRLAFCYSSTIQRPTIAFPMNFVLRPDTPKQCSGNDSTADDNTLGGGLGCDHDFAVCVLKPLVEEDPDAWDDLDRCFTYQEAHHVYNQYGDDVIESYSDEVAEAYSTERKIAAGTSRMTEWPKDKQGESRDLDGLVFLGGRFYFHPQHQLWVPVADSEKLKASFLKADSDVSPGKVYYRALAYKLETFWDLEARQFFSAICARLRAMGHRPSAPPGGGVESPELLMDPPDGWYEALYLGSE